MRPLPNSPAQRIPAVVQSFGNPDYYFDWSNQFYWGCPVSMGSGNNGLNYANSAYYHSDAGSSSGTYYSQWKDGICRPSNAGNLPRSTDYGLWIEGGPNHASNYLLQCRVLTNAAWVISNSTDITVLRTAIVGADGVSGNGNKLTAAANNGTIAQTITFTGKLDLSNASAIVTPGTGYTANDILTLVGGTGTAATIKILTVSGGVPQTWVNQSAGSYTVFPTNPVAVTGGTGVGATFNPFWRTGTFSCWMKRVTGTGAIYMSTNNFSSTTQVDSLINSNYYVQVRIPTTNLLNNVAGIKMAVSGDVIDVDFCQFEDDDQATSPIVSVGTVQARGPENVFFGTNASNFNQGLQIIYNTQSRHPFAYMFVYSGNFSTTLQHALLASDTALNVNSTGAGGNTFSFGGVTSAADTSGLLLNNNGSGVLNKVVVSVGGGQSYISVNGSAPTIGTAAPATSFSGTHFNILNNGTNITPCNGYMKQMAVWARALTANECQQYSTVTNNQ